MNIFIIKTISTSNIALSTSVAVFFTNMNPKTYSHQTNCINPTTVQQLLTQICYNLIPSIAGSDLELLTTATTEVLDL